MKIIHQIGRFAKYAFSAQIQAKKTQHVQPRTLIINENLKFNAKEFDLYVLPSHPKILTKGFSFFEIDTQSPVLELAFVRRTQTTEELGRLWGERKTFEFNFNQLHTLLDVEIGSNSSVKIEKSSDERSQITYEIASMSDKKEIQFAYEQKMVKSAGERGYELKFFAALEQSQFQIVQSVIKESLLDLSGHRFIFEMRRKQQIDAVRKELGELKSRQKQTKSFYSE